MEYIEQVTQVTQEQTDSKKPDGIMVHQDEFYDTSEFDIKVSTNKVKLKYKNGTGWNIEGVAAKLKDTGDGVKLNIEGNKIELDYSEYEVLLAILIVHENSKPSGHRTRVSYTTMQRDLELG